MTYFDLTKKHFNLYIQEMGAICLGIYFVKTVHYFYPFDMADIIFTLPLFIGYTVAHLVFMPAYDYYFEVM